jgi:transcriptional regulator with XRE-family HTH domain
VDAEEQLRRNIKALMRVRRMTQADLADKLGETQPWVSKRMSATDHSVKWKIEDLDALERVFGIAAWELLRPGHGQDERRTVRQRRRGGDRRLSSRTEGATSEDRTAPFDPQARALDAHLQITQAIESSNALFELAERLHMLANGILDGRLTALAAPSAGRLSLGGGMDPQDGGPHTEKAG